MRFRGSYHFDNLTPTLHVVRWRRAEIFRFSILKPVNSVGYFNVRSHYRLSYGGIYSKTPFWVWCSLCWHLPIFPGRHQPSIFGTTELNFCVRYGNRWTLSVINTNYFTLIYIKTFQPYSLLVTRGGIEPPFSAWEANVLTAWLTSHIKIRNRFSPIPYQWWYSFRDSNPGPTD